MAGVVAPSASGFRERNTFGRSFGEAGLQMPGMEVQMQVPPRPHARDAWARDVRADAKARAASRGALQTS